MNVRENILEMKGLSELMITLAYTALLQKDDVLASYVRELFSRISSLQNETLKLIFKVKIDDEERVSLVNILEYIKDYGNSSLNMIDLVSEDLPEILKSVLNESSDKVMTKILRASSVLNNRTIGEEKLRSSTGVTVISVKRDNSWFVNITHDFRLKEGDLLIYSGNPKKVDAFTKML